MKKNSGITLIALVITIVVLLILAGISISAVFGRNGIIDKTNEAKYLTKLREYEEKVTGTLEVRQIFKFSKVGLIAGCHVLSGTVKNNEKARIIRDNVVVYNGSIKSLQREKDQVKEVKKDMDCGLTLENCQDYKEKDIIEVYDLVEIKR